MCAVYCRFYSFSDLSAGFMEVHGCYGKKAAGICCSLEDFGSSPEFLNVKLEAGASC